MEVAVQKINEANLDISQSDMMRVYITQVLSTAFFYLSKGIVPIFIFDGKHTILKADTKKKRSTIRVDARQEAAQLRAKLEALPYNARSRKDIEDYKKSLAKSARVTDTLHFNSIRALNELGIPVFQAKGDGERLCATLVREKYAAFMSSPDYDSLVHGASIVCLEQAAKSNSGNSKFVRLDYVLGYLQMNHSQFVDFAIYCGCDYNHGIAGTGPVKAYNEMIKIGRLENSQINVTELNPIGCRNEFRFLSYKELIEYGDCIDLQKVRPTAHDFFAGLGYDQLASRYSGFYESVKIRKDFNLRMVLPDTLPIDYFGSTGAFWDQSMQDYLNSHPEINEQLIAISRPTEIVPGATITGEVLPQNTTGDLTKCSQTSTSSTAPVTSGTALPVEDLRILMSKQITYQPVQIVNTATSQFIPSVYGISEATGYPQSTGYPTEQYSQYSSTQYPVSTGYPQSTGYLQYPSTQYSVPTQYPIEQYPQYQASTHYQVSGVGSTNQFCPTLPML